MAEAVNGLIKGPERLSPGKVRTHQSKSYFGASRQTPRANESLKHETKLSTAAGVPHPNPCPSGLRVQQLSQLDHCENIDGGYPGFSFAEASYIGIPKLVSSNLKAQMARS